MEKRNNLILRMKNKKVGVAGLQPILISLDYSKLSN